MTLDRGRVEEALSGSPYSIANDDEAGTVADLLERSEGLEARCQVVRDRLRGEFAVRLAMSSRTVEIYESNAIEGKAATLADTYELFRTRSLWSADAAIARYTLYEALADEPKVQDVVGLAAARILVDQYIAEPDRVLTETDLRDMHGLILPGHPAAGRYKRYVNEIEGSEHHPLPPSDVPAAMGQLTNWASATSAPALWRAAVAHAWLTHIHPFEDGNGRVARLLANYFLGFGCFPPLIVKSTSDRGRYISALGASDTGGDLTQLMRVFVRVLTRQIALMESPEFAWSLFEKDLRVREQDAFVRWREIIDQFLVDVASHLRLSGKRMVRTGTLAASDFELLQARNPGGNGWLAKAAHPRAPVDLVVWAGYASGQLRNRLYGDQIFPSLFLSEKDIRPRPPKPYLQSVRGLPPRFDELCVIADEGRALIRRGDSVVSVSLLDATELYAAMLSDYLDRFARSD